MKKFALFNFPILLLLVFASSLTKLSAMEEDEKGNKIPQKQTSKENINTAHSITDYQTDDTEESIIESTSHLGKLPAELLECIFFYTLAPIKNLDEATKSLNVFNNAIYKTCAINGFINKKFTDPDNLCSKCRNINPFFITRKLKISGDLHAKLTTIAIKQKLKKLNLTIKDLKSIFDDSKDKTYLTKMLFIQIRNLNWMASKKTEELAKNFNKEFESEEQEIKVKLLTMLALINAGVNINEYESYDSTILKQSIIYIPKPLAVLKIVEFLLKLGANPNIIGLGKPSTLNVALMRYKYATQQRQVGNLQYIYSGSEDLSILESLIRALLEFGADPNVTDVNGHTVLYYARIFNLPNLVTLLKNYGAKLSWKDIFSWRTITNFKVN